MRKLVMATALLVLSSSMALMAQQSKNASAPKAEKKILVTYFTFPERDGVDASTGASRIVVSDKMYGTTEYVAKVIAEETGADMFQIKTAHTYPNSTHKELIDYAKKEADTKTYPKITSKISNFADYDVVFVGYPNWWYDMPMVIYTLFNEYDFSGKTIVPFCTHGGSGFSQSVQTIEKLEKGAKIISIPAISRNNVSTSRGGLLKWLQEKGFTNKQHKKSIEKTRVVLTLLFILCITLLFLDFTGTIHRWMGWMAKIQFLPALENPVQNAPLNQSNLPPCTKIRLTPCTKIKMPPPIKRYANIDFYVIP